MHYRSVQLLEGGIDVRSPALLLHRDHLRAMLHDRHRLMDVILDRPQGGKHMQTNKDPFTLCHGGDADASCFLICPKKSKQ